MRQCEAPARPPGECRGSAVHHLISVFIIHINLPCLPRRVCRVRSTLLPLNTATLGHIAYPYLQDCPHLYRSPCPQILFVFLVLLPQPRVCVCVCDVTQPREHVEVAGWGAGCRWLMQHLVSEGHADFFHLMVRKDVCLHH